MPWPERYLRGESAGHTLQPTALVHEAYMKLVDQTRVQWQGRTHFLAVGAQAMRRILVDHARRRGSSPARGRPPSDRRRRTAAGRRAAGRGPAGTGRGAREARRPGPCAGKDGGTAFLRRAERHRSRRRTGHLQAHRRTRVGHGPELAPSRTLRPANFLKPHLSFSQT